MPGILQGAAGAETQQRSSAFLSWSQTGHAPSGSHFCPRRGLRRIPSHGPGGCRASSWGKPRPRELSPCRNCPSSPCPQTATARYRHLDLLTLVMSLVSLELPSAHREARSTLMLQSGTIKTPSFFPNTSATCHPRHCRQRSVGGYPIQKLQNKFLA